MHWKIAAELPAINGQSQSLGYAGPVVGLHHDVLIVAGGSNFPDGMPWLGGKKKYYGNAYALKKTNGQLEGFKTFQLPDAIAYAACCSASKGIVCAGGENNNGISNKAWLLQWDETAQNLIIKNLPDLPIAVTNAMAAANGNKVYVAGGEISDGVSNHVYCLDLNNITAGWKSLPSLPKPVSHAVMAVQYDAHDECLYVIGGRRKLPGGISELYNSVYQLDLKNQQWQQKKSLPYALSAGTGVAIDKHYILLFGGDKGETFHQTEELIAAINAEKDGSKKEMLNRQKMQLQAHHPGFSNKVLQYNTITNEWKAIDTIPFAVPVTTSAVRWGNAVLIPNGEIRAGVRTPQILEGKMSDGG